MGRAARVMKTRYCVYCLKGRAVSWCGHVVNLLKSTSKKKSTVLAGWCFLHEDGASRLKGFVGHFKRSMGVVPWGSGR